MRSGNFRRRPRTDLLSSNPSTSAAMRGIGLALLGALCLCPMSVAFAEPTGGSGAPVGLDLPLYDPALGWNLVPAYAAHKLEIRLASEARPRDTGLVAAHARTGSPAIDRLLDRFSVARLEPEFPGTSPPEPGSGLEDLTSFYIVHLPEWAALAEALGAFRSEPSVESADPIGIFPAAFFPNDSLFSLEYPLHQANDRDGDLPEAWDLAPGDTSLAMAIVDTGVLWTHPDLGGAPPYTSGNLWHNWVEIGGTAGFDDDGNGLNDDFIGWDFVTGKTGRAGEDLNAPDNDPSDFVGHGTFVAGIAGAIADNTSGIAGAGGRVKIMALRVGWDDGLGPGGVVDMSFCAQAITYAALKHATVINCSWSNGNLSGLGAAVSNAIALGSTVVVAAGNQSTSTPTGNYLGLRGDCVDVAALEPTDVLASTSNYGPWIDVCAGGVGLPSTNSTHYAPGYSTGSGTSFAAPVVSGIVAVYQSGRRSQGLPPATPAQVLLRLHDTADLVDAVNNPFFSGQLGGGRVNAARAILDPPTSFVVSTPGGVSVAPAFVNWGGAADAIIFGTALNRILAIDGATGVALTGWPVNTGGSVSSNPTVWDVDFDGSPEVLVGADDGKLYALESNGGPVSGWPITLGGMIRSGPSLHDVTGDPAYEIVVGTTAPNALHVLDRTGAERIGWPKTMPAALEASPALSDLDGNGKAEIVIGCDDSTVYAFKGDGDALGGWPIRVDGMVVSQPAIADLDGNGVRDVICGSADGKVHAWSASGVPIPGWPVTTSGGVRSSPVLADLDGDGRLEVVVGTDNGLVYAWNDDGSPLSGWPANVGGAVRGSPVIGDVDHDGSLDVVVGSFAKRVYALRLDGGAVPGWPRDLLGNPTGAGSLGDPDRDGRLEVAVGDASGRLTCWDFGPSTYDSARLPWFTAGRSFLRQGSIVLPAIAVEGPAPSLSAALSLSPNPFRGRGRIHLAMPGARGERAEIAFFDVAGRRLYSQGVWLDASGSVSCELDLLGHRAPSPGIYWVVARAGSARLRAKWVLLP